MDDYHTQSPNQHPQIFRACQIAVRSAANTPMLSLNHQFTNPAYFIHNHPHNNLQQYEQQWEHNILNQMVREMQQSGLRSQNKILRYGEFQQNKRLDQLRPKNIHPTNRSKKKQLSKYKAYAVKMKITQNIQQPSKPKIRQKQSSASANSDSKNKSDFPLRQERQLKYLKGEDIFRVNVRDIAMFNLFQNNGVNIFKKRPHKASNHNNIRKRSIKTSQKKKLEDVQAKQSINKYLKTSTSPKLAKKFIMSLDQSTFQNHQHVQKSGQNIANSNKMKKQNEVNKKLLTKSTKSPQKLTEKDQRPAFMRNKQFTMKVQVEETTKFIQKIQKAIHFRKKETKPQSPIKEAQKKTEIQPMDKNFTKSNMNLDAVSGSKSLVKAIYTSKDIIRNKSNILKESASKDLDISRRQSGNHKVFMFNSEDQYVRRILIKAGWIQNHDTRSHFYNLKWVFKPDSIDYLNLKPNQIVNHVQNSHELTAKNYLNKNLKSHIVQWPSMNMFYPKSYDLGRASQKQDFYQQYKKQVMMLLLRNLYDYFIQVRTSYIQSLTAFYLSILNQDGTYDSESKGQSQLRNKNFRKIDLEDYKNYDNQFLVHMNLFVISLKYWRQIRKQEDLMFDEQPHFLAFRQKQFENNFHHLERYSKMTLPFNSQIQPYFQQQYFATPSQTAIQKFVKEYVYFENQLKRQWRIFGNGNTWIVKPCSASRGNGIYLTNDCSEVLTDNRGIQSKIVQRYIERPLILKSGLVSGKKFDLRQWVLLKSVEPLEIYMFSHCYVRICSDEFNMSNISNLKAHLTNYSFNKKHYKRPSESVIDQDTFQEMLLQQRNINFVEYVRPKIKQIIINSIKSTQHLISDCNQRCFSLLGYDILLDADSEPWLLEINMSPACQERTQWLKCYLQIMGKQLLKIVQPDYMPPTSKEAQSPLKQPQELKKIKTEMSQSNFEATSYVNAIFSLDKKQTIAQDPIALDESMSSLEWKEERMNKQGLVVQDEDCNDEEWQKMEIEEDDCCDQQEQDICTIENTKQRLNTQKFKNLQLFLQEQEKKKSLSPPRLKEQFSLAHLAHEQSKQSLNYSNKQSKPQSMQEMELILKWQKICHQEYFSIKKDGDLQMQVLGSKIISQKLDHLEQYLGYVAIRDKKIQKKCITVQQSIRSFLIHRRNKSKMEKQLLCLKINVSKLMMADSQRQAKSSLQSRDHNLSIREINGTKEPVERPITARVSSATSKYKNEVNFREKIRSIVSKAAARMNLEKQEQSVVKDKLIKEQMMNEVVMKQETIQC